MTFRTANGLIGLATLLAATCFGAQLKLPPYTRTVLPNGTVLLLMEQHEVPLVNFNVLISAGSTEDQHAGLASLTAELLQRGTTTRSSRQLAGELDFLGGLMEFDAGLDFAMGHAEFLAKDTKAGLELLADVLLNPGFAKEEVEKRVRQRIDELKQDKDEPQAAITNYYHAFLFGPHPYGAPIRGDERSVATITREDVVKFYQEHYLPQNIRIAAVGDFSTPEMQQMLAGRFGSHKRSPGAPRQPIAAAEPVHGRKLLLIDKPDSTQSFYMIGNVGISRTNPDRFVILLVNTIFGGRFTSMLNDELRVSSGLTYGARSTFWRYQEPGPFAISSFTRNATTVEAIDMTLAIMRRLHEKGVTEEQLKSAKAYVKGQFPPQIETPDQLAGLLTQLDFFGLDEREINDLFQRLDAVTLADCKRVVREHFPMDDYVMVVIGKAAEIKQKLSKYASTMEVRDIGQVGYK